MKIWKVMCITGIVMGTLMCWPGMAAVIDAMSTADGWTEESEAGTVLNVSHDADENALKLEYDFTGGGNWTQVKKTVTVAASTMFSLVFQLKGDGAGNNFELKLEDKDGVTYGKNFGAITANGGWKNYTVALKELTYYWTVGGGDDTEIDWANITRIWFAITRAAGGGGTVWIKNVITEKEGYTAPEPQDRFYYVPGDAERARNAARWIASMQQPSGLVLSYEREAIPFGWTYDQALCLIVFAHENVPAARKLLAALRKLQKPEGYWNDGLMLDNVIDFTLKEEDKKKWFPSEVPGVRYEFDNRWIGTVSWIVHAIERYIDVTGDTSYADMIEKGAAWLVTQQREDGSLHDSTEGNLDAWWALMAGKKYAEADTLKDYLLTKIWDDKEGRFLVGQNNYQIYLDPQTWGSPFCVAAGVPETGLRALAFAKKYLACKTFDRLTRGFDTTGPYTVWNEGTLQYVVAGGADAHIYLAEMNKQQRADGALQHSHEDYTFGGAWHSVMYGVCPTAWLYFANMGTEPFVRHLLEKHE